MHEQLGALFRCCTLTLTPVSQFGAVLLKLRKGQPTHPKRESTPTRRQAHVSESRGELHTRHNTQQEEQGKAGQKCSTTPSWSVVPHTQLTLFTDASLELAERWPISTLMALAFATLRAATQATASSAVVNEQAQRQPNNVS